MAQPTEYEQVTYNAPDGAQFGKASTDKISFWGQTPVVRGTSTVAMPDITVSWKSKSLGRKLAM